MDWQQAAWCFGMSFSLAGLFVGCYLLGSIPTGYWLAKAWKGIDVRQHGSGNLGATNVFRVLGPWPGGITLAIDILKGLAAVGLAKVLFPAQVITSLGAGLAAIVGHTMSVFVRFRGGKGVATSAGVFLALLPVPSLLAVSSFGIIFGITRYVSLGSLCAALVLVLSAFALSSPRPLSWATVGIFFFVIWTHRANIKRLLEGTENRIDWGRAR